MYNISKLTLTHVVDIVEDTDAGLLLATLPLFPVIGLSLLQTPSVAPLTEGTLPWRWDPLASWSPVPAVDNGRLEILALTALEVALPSSCPDVVKVLLPDEVLDPVLLGHRVDGDGVHAELATVVPGSFPVPFGVGTNC